MVDIIIAVCVVLGICCDKPKIETVESTEIVDDSKSGLSSKGGMSKDCIYDEPLPNPLDRIVIQWNPPIINPPKVTDVDP